MVCETAFKRGQRLIARPQILLGAMQAQHRAHARQQFLRIERLGNVIIRADVEAERFLRGLVAARDHDDQQPLGARGRAQAAAHGVAVHVGQHHVEQHQIDLVPLGRVQPIERVLPGVHQAHVIAGLRQQIVEEAGDHFVVVDDEDGSAIVRHASDYRTKWNFGGWRRAGALSAEPGAGNVGGLNHARLLRLAAPRSSGQ